MAPLCIATLCLATLCRTGVVVAEEAATPAAKTAPPADQSAAAEEPAAPAANQPRPRWKLTTGLAAPESAYFDAGTQAIYVSNIDGSPGEKDGKGYIAKLGLDGKMIAERWVEGMNAPKGIRTHAGKLYVTDLDRVQVIDLKTARITGTIIIKNAKFLNDVAIDDAGTVYVSDLLDNTIYRIAGDTPAVWVSGKEVPHPNGLLVHDSELIVASWGEGLDSANFTTKQPGQLLSFDLKSKARQILTPDGLGNLDGLENDGSGGYYASDYLGGNVFHVGADGTARVILSGLPSPADLGMVEGAQLLLVPLMSENALAAYELPDLQ
ncbi:MAG: hypothetical protein SFX18_16140 [Pirellulales bacterium]|nr:hypothetical protein [Pirellulales bacterium]